MFVFFLSIGFLPFVIPESCFYQHCLNCYPDQVASPGTPVQCDPANWVSAQWLHNYGHPPPSTDSRIPIEYRCLKMVATPDDKTFGNTVDVIKGCIPKMQVNSVCHGLEAVERARGHSDARCHICYGNNCNSVATLHTTIVVTAAAVLLNFIFR